MASTNNRRHVAVPSSNSHLAKTVSYLAWTSWGGHSFQTWHRWGCRPFVARPTRKRRKRSLSTPRLQANVELAHFVPLIIGQGGNAGSQAVSSVIRALAGKEIDVRSRAVATSVVGKEVAVGALCGLVLGICVLSIGHMFRIVSINVGIVVCISLPLVSLWANFLGAALPLIAARLQQNPALTSAPLMTTIIDSSGLVIYFYVAMWYLEFQGHVVDLHHSPHRAHRHGAHHAHPTHPLNATS